MRTKGKICILGILLLISLTTISASENAQDPQFGIDDTVCKIDGDSCSSPADEFNNNQIDESCPPLGICVAFFYSPTCEHCHRVDQLLSSLENRYPQIKVNRFNAIREENAELKEAFDILYDVPEKKRASVPAVYVGDYYFIGGLEAEGIEDAVNIYLETGSPCSCTDFMEAHDMSRDSIINRFKSFSFITIVFAGLVDSVNPCAFAGIIFFISYLAITGRKGKILLIGVLYALGVFAAYLSISFGFTKFITYTEQASIISKLIYPITGIVALAFAAYSFLDYRKAKQGRTEDMTLQLPQRYKKTIHSIIRKFMGFRYLLLTATVVGFVISLFEFLCTGQVYLPTIIYIMSVPELKSQAAFYLILYNLLFILPLIAIFTAAYLGTTSRQLQQILIDKSAVIKLATAVFFLLLGAYLITTSLRLFAII